MNHSRKYLFYNHFWNSYYINKFSVAFLWFLKVYASNSKRYFFFFPLYLWSSQSDKSFRGLRPSGVLLSSRILYLRWTFPCLTSWLIFFFIPESLQGLVLFKNLPWYTELSLYFILGQLLLPYTGSINSRTIHGENRQEVNSCTKIKSTSWSKRLPSVFFYFSDYTF